MITWRLTVASMTSVALLGTIPGLARTQEPGRAPWDVPALSLAPTPSWLALSGELRVRLEGRSGLGFREDASDAYGLVRTRLNVDLRPHEIVHLFAQVQDARAPGIVESRATGVFRDPLDLRQAYVRLRTESGRMALTAGRQLLLYGDQRLIGPLDWTNTARSFDAAKLEIRTTDVEVDVFSARVVRNDPSRRLNRSDWDDGIHGVYATVRTSAPLVIQPLLLWRTMPTAAGGGTTDRYSAGLRLEGRGDRFDAALTYVEQWGRAGPLDIRARGLSAAAGYRLALPASPRVSAELGHATGDQDTADGELGTFDQIFPTGHLYHGYNDLVGWRNIQALRIGLGAAPTSRLTVSADFHAFRLATRGDGLYDAGGTPSIPAPPGGAVDGEVGQELDLTLGLRVSETVSLSSGLGHFFPGAYVRASTPGAGNTFAYGSLTLTF